MSDKELCDGVKILIERMKTNPEEFTYDSARWSSFLPTELGGYSSLDGTLDEHEIAALTDGIRAIRKKRFTDSVMAEILRDNEENKVKEAPYPSSGIMGQGKRVILPQPLAQQQLGQLGGYQISTSNGVGGGSGTWVQTDSYANLTQQRADALGIGHLIKKTLGFK